MKKNFYFESNQLCLVAKELLFNVTKQQYLMVISFLILLIRVMKSLTHTGY
ncbi:hypothetical protein H311_01626 [Anncaliia algerae PRA109]|nr:hypothetical protein H311_01626 [Anncaliia algerae PRA109]